MQSGTSLPQSQIEEMDIIGQEITKKNEFNLAYLLVWVFLVALTCCVFVFIAIAILIGIGDIETIQSAPVAVFVLLALAFNYYSFFFVVCFAPDSASIVYAAIITMVLEVFAVAWMYYAFSSYIPTIILVLPTTSILSGLHQVLEAYSKFHTKL